MLPEQDTRQRPFFYTVLHQPPRQSVLLLPADGRSTGAYHCEVSDLFDNTTVIQSEKMYLDKEGRRQVGDKSILWPLEMESMVLSYEDDLDLEEYRESADVVTAAGMHDSDPGSMASTDE
ncbi:hypothetical protein CRUP_003007 [Coryphaenoides rupestris]|nr:hypothetical protein CRUP_003007 [Coryphaenoides rupestris]